MPNKAYTIENVLRKKFSGLIHGIDVTTVLGIHVITIYAADSTCPHYIHLDVAEELSEEKFSLVIV